MAGKDAVQDAIFIQTLKDIKLNTDKVPALVEAINGINNRCDGRKEWISKTEAKTEANEKIIQDVDLKVENLKGKFWIIPIIASAISSAICSLIIALLLLKLSAEPAKAASVDNSGKEIAAISEENK